jgi:putative proteasome-type protease
MTYCVAMLLDAGLVFLSDSRTNAGVDQINTFRKTTVFERAGDRVIVLMSAGNLAITQGVLNLLAERMSAPGEGNLLNCPNLFEAARCVGSAMREMHNRDAEALRQQGIEFNASFILGGQIKGETPRLFHVYSAGNFVEATPDTTYFQIGESKYGKPIIDRVIRRSMPLSEAAKCALISMDSTTRPRDHPPRRMPGQQPCRHRLDQRILPPDSRALGRSAARDFLGIAEPGLAAHVATRARPARAAAFEAATREVRPSRYRHR